MKFLTIIVMLILALSFPIVAQADSNPSTHTLDAQATNIDSYIGNGGTENIVTCDESVQINPGTTHYLGYPGQYNQNNTNGGPRAWHVGVFFGWSWHGMYSGFGDNGMQDTGFATQRFGAFGNDTHDLNTMNWVEVGTRRYWHSYVDSAYDVGLGLKIVHDTGPWAMTFSRADC